MTSNTEPAEKKNKDSAYYLGVRFPMKNMTVDIFETIKYKFVDRIITDDKDFPVFSSPHILVKTVLKR